VRGRFNSSITRVRPTFQALLDRDASGRSWLRDVLLAAPHGDRLPPDVLENPGYLQPDLAMSRTYRDKILGAISLPECFERAVPPSGAFLRWLIGHPQQLRWPVGPDGAPRRFGNKAQERRQWLRGQAGVERQHIAMNEALDGLLKHGPEGSARRWWAFEGFTEVDCCLETDRLVLFVEGGVDPFVLTPVG
jgi:hypothetical protein